MSRTVSFATLGCKTNQFESAAMEERLKQAGYQVVPFDDGAELVIVNTCTVTSATDSQSRNLVRRARRHNPDCRIIVTGCYAQVDPEALKAIAGVALVIGNEEKKDLLSLLDDTSAADKVHVSDIRSSLEARPLELSSYADRSRAFVQIQNGCDAFCSYCIIPYARGRSRSVVPDAVVEQVRQLAQSGHAEIVLTGIHIGAYGADLVPRCSLVDLLGRIEKETPVKRLRLGSIEPLEFGPDLIEAVAGSSIICPHFHIPLQAGDDEVLARMNRHYDTGFFRDLVLRIVQKIPEAAIGLDVITGFPAETQAEFENTLALLQELPLSHLHVFPFSKRPGTPAATMAGQLSGDLIKARAARMRDIGQEKEEAFSRRFIGTLAEVVVEGGIRGKTCRGVTRNYLGVRFEGSEDLAGKAVPVRIEKWTEKGLEGSLL